MHAIIEALVRFYQVALGCGSLGDHFPTIPLTIRYQKYLVEAAVRIETMIHCPAARPWPEAWSTETGRLSARFTVKASHCVIDTSLIAGFDHKLFDIVNQVGMTIARAKGCA